MKIKITALSLMLIMFCGCGYLVEHAEEIEMLGEATAAAAPTITAINPAVGMWMIITSGLLIAVGTSFKKKG